MWLVGVGEIFGCDGRRQVWVEAIGVASEQGFIQDFKLGGGNPCFVEARQTRGVWGHASPENF